MILTSSLKFGSKGVSDDLITFSLDRKFGLRDLYKPGMHQLSLNIYILQGLIIDLAPDLNSHLVAQGLELSSFASSWFLTLFTTTFPIKVCSRILDCLLLDGPEIIFKVALAVLLAEKEKLKILDMENMLDYLQKQAPKLYDVDPSLLIQKAQNYKVDMKDRKIRKLEKEYIDKKNKEKEEMVEISRLRQENTILRERVEALEKENQNLAKNLANSKISHALQQEKEMIMKKELNTVRKHNNFLANTPNNLEGSRENLSRVSSTGNPQVNMVNSINDINKNNLTEQTSVNSLQQQTSYSDQFVLQLQEELVASRLREAVLDEQVKDLEHRSEVAEKKNIENSKDRQLLQSQQELVKFKMRYAESQSAVRDLQSRIEKLEAAWVTSNKSSSSYGSGIGMVDTYEHSLTREANLGEGFEKGKSGLLG